MRYIIAYIFLVITVNNISSQVTQEWMRRYNSLDPGNGARTKAIAIDSSGNIYVAGQDAGYDLVLIKYNSYGGQLWIKYGDFGGAEINYIEVDKNGDVYLAGKNSGLFLVKYHRGGVKLWDRTYQGDYYSEANGLVITPSGYPIVAGTLMKNEYTKEDYCAVKYTPDGDTVWTRIYNSGGNNRDEATSLSLALDGSICITGSRWNSATGMYHSYLTVKYDSSGNYKWANVYGSPDSNYYAEDAEYDKLGNIHITGTQMPGIFQTIKYNINGLLIWKRTYSVTSPSTAKKIKIDIFGNVIVCGSSSETSMSGPFITTIKYDPAGYGKWIKYFSEFNDSTTILGDGTSMIIDNYCNIYMTGSYIMRNWPPPAMYGMFTMKYKSDGSISWIKEFHGNYNSDGGSSIVLDKNNNVFVTGNSCDTVYKWGIVTVKYAQSVGIKESTSNIPNKFLLYQNYPNPFNSLTNIRFQIPKSSYIVLKVYNIIGKETNKLIDNKLNSGEYIVGFDGNNLSSGIYFYSLYADGKLIDIKKIIILK